MSALALKVLALVSMLIDHAGAVFFPQYRWMRYVGRLAFPIYAFLICEGYVYTRNVYKYLLRLGIFALLSEVPYDLAFNDEINFFKDVNVYFTLFFGLLSLVLIDYFSHHTVMQCVCVASLSALVQVMVSDYRFIGVCLITVFYLYRDNLPLRAVGAANALIPFSSRIEGLSLVAALPLGFYNRKPGRLRLKYFFYAIYPVHLLVYVFIRDRILI